MELSSTDAKAEFMSSKFPGEKILSLGKRIYFTQILEPFFFKWHQALNPPRKKCSPSSIFHP